MGCGASGSDIRDDNISAPRQSASNARCEAHHPGEASRTGVFNSVSKDAPPGAREYRQAPGDAARDLEKAVQDACALVAAMHMNPTQEPRRSTARWERSSIRMIIPRYLPRRSDECESEAAVAETFGSFWGRSISASEESLLSWVSESAEECLREDEASVRKWYIQECLEELRDGLEKDPKDAAESEHRVS
mmetsp:Transcript_59172/g.105166  ORF Transcript_59172/g.105166 Transcript_59172/m.105166 type:complete len:191 (+) Transcript_59172:48-620(+)